MATISMMGKVESVLTRLAVRKMVAQVVGAERLASRLDAGEVTFYIGIDPTGPSLHCGHLVPLYLLIALARRGNRAVVIIGDGTAQIGDPSGKTDMRPIIGHEEIARNADTIEAQLQAILSRAGVEGVQFARNSEWLNTLSYIEFLRDIGSRFSVNRMLTFESVKRRLAQQQGLSFLEFNYMLLQAYDFLMLFQQHGCTLQIAGDDQWGNIVCGIDLIRRKEQSEAYALTTPLILTANGEKMGKTASGALFIDSSRTPVFEYYQYWRNVDDRDLRDCLLRFTDCAEEEVPVTDASQEELNAAKARLAREMTRFAHGEEQADSAERAAQALFGGAEAGRIGGGSEAAGAGSGSAASSGGGELSGEVELPGEAIAAATLDDGIPAIDLFTATPLCASKSEAKRLIQQGGAQANGRKIADPQTMIDTSWLDNRQRLLLRAGKKRSWELRSL